MDTDSKIRTGKEEQTREPRQETATADLILRRLERLEQEVGTLTGMVRDGQELFREATRLGDEAYPGPSANGVSTQQRVGNALHLAKRLTAPDVVARFDQVLEASAILPDLYAVLKGISEDVIAKLPREGMLLDERIDAISSLAGRLTDPVRVARVNQLLDLLDMAPDVMEALSGVVQDVLAQAPPEGLRMDERIRAVLPLLDKLTTPEIVEKLTELLTLTEMAPDLIQTVSGVAGDIMAQAPPEGLRMDERLQALLPLIYRLTDPKFSTKLNQFLALGDHLPDVNLDISSEQLRNIPTCQIDVVRLLRLATATGAAFCEAAKEPTHPMGLMGMFRAPFDRDRQVAIGFLMTFLKKFGQKVA